MGNTFGTFTKRHGGGLSPGMDPGEVRPLNPAWIALPLLSLGFAAFAPLLYAAIRRSSRRLGVCAALYLVADLVFVALSSVSKSHSAGGGVAGAGIICIAIGGSVHVAAIRKPAARPLDAVARVRLERERRRRARAIAASDPRLALEAGIGRPDLPGHEDDGGLVDVNHAPASVLATLPGIDASIAHRIADACNSVGGFLSAAHVSIALDLPPQQLRDAEDRMLFLPLYAAP
jgi:hypothetical protein